MLTTERRSRTLALSIRKHWNTLGRPNMSKIAVTHADRDLLPTICDDFNREHSFFKAIVSDGYAPGMSDSIALLIFYIGSREHTEYLQKQELQHGLS